MKPLRYARPETKLKRVSPNRIRSPSKRSCLGHFASVIEGVEIVAADDDVVEDRNPKKVAGILEPLREGAVFRARVHAAGWM